MGYANAYWPLTDRSIHKETVRSLKLVKFALPKRIVSSLGSGGILASLKQDTCSSNS